MPSGRIEEAVDLARSLGNARSVGGWKKSLAGIALMRGDHAQARRLFDESLAIHRSLGDAQGCLALSLHLALLALEAGDPRVARPLSEALAIERERGPEPMARERARDLGEARRDDGEPTLAPSAAMPTLRCSARSRGRLHLRARHGPIRRRTSATSAHGWAR